MDLKLTMADAILVKARKDKQKELYHKDLSRNFKNVYSMDPGCLKFRNCFNK